MQAQRKIEEQNAALKDQDMERSAAAQNRGRLAAAQKQLKALEWEHEVCCPSCDAHACDCIYSLTDCVSVPRSFTKLANLPRKLTLGWNLHIFYVNSLMTSPLQCYVTCMQVLLQRYEQLESETARLSPLCSLHDQSGCKSHLLTKCNI